MGHEQSKGLTQTDIDELKQNTNFSHGEIQDWYDKFHADYPEGVISKEGFVHMYQQMFPQTSSREFAEHVFRAYDADGNGEIDFHEFLATLSVASRGNVDEKLEWAFSMYDIDKNGSVSRAEAIQIISAIYKMRGEPRARDKAEQTALELFMILDKNKDDSLSKKEFIHAAKHSTSVRDLLTKS